MCVSVTDEKTILACRSFSMTSYFIVLYLLFCVFVADKMSSSISYGEIKL